MAGELQRTSARDLRTLVRVGAAGGMTDGQLLARFALRGGEAAELAFAALVDRHGPMVLGTCRAVLRDPHAADDAFQATFLVLARRARSLRSRDTLGPWLHQVALRTARGARRAEARRRRLDRHAAMPPEATPSVPDPDAAERAGLVHEELGRLPEPFRAAVVLCDLEGLTHEQAAAALGRPVGTVRSRLSRGRARLRERLERRQVALGLVGPGLAAPVGEPLAGATARLAARVAAGEAAAVVASSAVAAMVGREMTAMIVPHGKALLGSLLLVVGAVGVGWMAQGRSAVDEATERRPEAVQAPEAARKAELHPPAPPDPDDLRSPRPGVDHVDRLDFGTLRVGARAEADVSIRFREFKESFWDIHVSSVPFVRILGVRTVRDRERPDDLICTVSLAVDTADLLDGLQRRESLSVVLNQDRYAKIPIWCEFDPAESGRPKVLVLGGALGSDSNRADDLAPWFRLVKETGIDVSYVDSFGKMDFGTEDRLAPELSRYDVIFVMDPTAAFGHEPLGHQMQRFVASKKRLIVTATPGLMSRIRGANELLRSFKLGFGFMKPWPEDAQVSRIAARVTAADPLTDGVNRLSLLRWTALNPSIGAGAATDALMLADGLKFLAIEPVRKFAVLAVERPESGGEVVALGMGSVVDFLDNSANEAPDDNARLLRNLLTLPVTPR